LKQDKFKHFGGLNIVWTGDYGQLEPPGSTPIYEGERCAYFHGMINAFIELDGMHRFKDDLPWGELLMRLRAGTATVDDIRTINNNCMVSDTHVPPAGIQVACFQNRDRDAINCATFEKFCQQYGKQGDLLQDAVFVFMDSLEMKDDFNKFVAVKSNAVKQHFLTQVGENDCRHGFGAKKNQRVEPTLKLYPNCPLMLTENKDVPNGQANGSRILLERINIKPNENPTLIELQCGAISRAYFASQVESLRVQHETDDIIPNTFDAKPRTYEFDATFEMNDDKKKCYMRGLQFGVVSNTATTGHKLQGYTAQCLLVNDWRYDQNWPYVVVSRVRTMKGLFLRVQLSEDMTKYAVKPAMLAMLKEFKERHLLTVLDDECLAAILNYEAREQ
jgi:hypothetical protein